MEAHSYVFSKIISSDLGADEHYHVPKYQREYTWGKRNWEQLMHDIDENPKGYFMGSIICVSESVLPGHEKIYQVIDGQQRLTTLSLLLAAIFSRLKILENSIEFEDDSERMHLLNTIFGIRSKLIKKKKDFYSSEKGGFVEQSAMHFLRVQPSKQNQNLDDYLFILSEIGLISEKNKPAYCSLRIMYKGYQYFLEQLNSLNLDQLLSLVAKINQLNFVLISVDTSADAFTLFETLNNRGVPLSAIDIIKNKILSEMENKHNIDIDDSYENWQKIIASIPDPSTQERFLRYYYNAFRWNENIRVEGIPRAIRSKIISIYENLIKKDAIFIFEDLCQKANLYGQLNYHDSENPTVSLSKKLEDLSYINASPAYQILLYLFSFSDDSFVEIDFLDQAVELLCKYYVRRNTTDFPPTRQLDQLHINLIENCQKYLENGNKLNIEYFSKLLLAGSDKKATLSQFEKSLRGNIYVSSSATTRYLLIKLNQIYHTKEYDPDLWKRDSKDRFVWTIEHVLPKTERISSEWVNMIADGNLELAKEQHEKCVHQLGNLTLSGFNSQLATANFEKKQSLSVNRKFLGHPINIGYKNGLALNQLEFEFMEQKLSLATADKWTTEMIEARTDFMVNLLLQIYTFE